MIEVYIVRGFFTLVALMGMFAVISGTRALYQTTIGNRSPATLSESELFSMVLSGSILLLGAVAVVMALLGAMVTGVMNLL